MRQGLRGGGAFFGQKLPLPLSNSLPPRKNLLPVGPDGLRRCLMSAATVVPALHATARQQPPYVFSLASPGDRH
ncbi:hypothetical protein DESPIGER_1364 [Desulfovibrio piger]|uniref:Uncharacterized protein n=1 Tax=Desulfovibrio piger TaxID=901 RepID=A0A1K1LEU1_9BACT|nr:hypothetical protein DESPIGER_1364 [Desulfovibrio piger]